MGINMGYCRFENTLEGLEECAEFIDENGINLDTLSESELKAAKRLLKICKRISDDYA